jgi:hypothetical protein
VFRFAIASQSQSHFVDNERSFGRCVRSVAWARMTTTDPTRVAGAIEGLTIKSMAKDAVRVSFRRVRARGSIDRSIDRPTDGFTKGHWNESFKICEMRDAE